MKQAMIFLALIIFACFSRAELINVKTLNQHLESTGADWYAEENSMTRLDFNEAQRLLGVPLEGASESEFEITDEDDAKIQTVLPPHLDWRNKDGKNWISPVKDQINCGSCVAFASIGVLESQLKISSRLSDLNVSLSPQHLFSCGGGFCGFGWIPELAARFLKNHGVPDESCMPYTSGYLNRDISCKETCIDAPKRVVKILDFAKPTFGFRNIKAVKEALQKGPLVTFMKVRTDFYAYANGVYRHKKGKLAGGHAISIVGYDDQQGAFIIRNSWGEEWGDKGYAKISYEDDSGVGNSTWQYLTYPLGGVVSVNRPEEYSYHSGFVPVVLKTNFSRAENLAADIYDQDKNIVRRIYCPASECVQDVDVKSLPDGKYFIRSFAYTSDGKKIDHSTFRQFFIVNNQPKVTINFAGTDKTNLSNSLKGKAKLQININSSSVPLSRLIFHRVGPDGKDRVRSIEMVPKKINLEWSTDLLPNGQYSLWFEGQVKSNSLSFIYKSSKKNVIIKN